MTPGRLAFGMVRLCSAILLWGVVGVTLNVLIAWALMALPMPTIPAAQFRISRDIGWIFASPIGTKASPYPAPKPPHMWTGKVFQRRGRCDLLTDSEIFWSGYTWPPWCNAGANTPDQPPSWWPGPALPSIPTSAQCFAIDEHAAGWPCMTLHSRTWITQVPGIAGGLSHPYSSGHGPAFDSAGVLNLAWTKRVWPTPLANASLPVLPLWPGFALNTVFYAAITWGLWQIPLAIRRTRRRRAGKCVRCGYDMKGLAAGSACPECGTV